MSRPASIRPQRPFVGKARKVGSKKLEIDWEAVEESWNHRFNIQLNNRALKRLRVELIDAEARGLSKAKKIRREINSLLEQNLALGCTWCRGCLNYLHNCKCPPLERGIHHNTIRARKRKEERAIERMDRAKIEFRQRFGIID